MISYFGRKNESPSLPIQWSFPCSDGLNIPDLTAGIFGYDRRMICHMILRETGAASISMGRTPHELHDELCRALAR